MMMRGIMVWKILMMGKIISSTNKNNSSNHYLRDNFNFLSRNAPDDENTKLNNDNWIRDDEIEI